MLFFYWKGVYMPQVAEYIAKISGDTTGLEKAIADAKGSVKKLAKDEVLIKLQYDGNVKDFNKQFDKILKDCPELTVQFQYNVNQKMLDKEMEKAKKLQELKLDINTGNVENRIRSMIEGLDNAIGRGESSDIIESKIKEIIRYGNTVKHAGGEIAKTYLKDILESVEGTNYEKLYNKILESPKLETMKLFDIKGPLDEELNAAEQRIQDFQSFLQSLESKGASKSGLSSELESLQDEIKILRSDLSDMKDELNSVSGEKFHLMTEEIKNVNEQLQIALEKIGKLTGDNKLGSIVNKWNREDITKEAERYTAFNSKTLETSGVHAAADAEGVSEELIRTAISEMGEEADGFIHTHPKRKAAFSDTDISTFYKLLEDGITQQVVTSYEQAMSLDMSKVNPEKKEEVVNLLKKQYDEAEQEIGGEFLRKNLDLVKNIANQVFEGNKTGNDKIDSLLENARKKYHEGLEKLGPEITLNQYVDLIDEALTSAFKESDFSKMAGTKTFEKVSSFLDQVGDAVVDSFSEQTGAGEVIQERFQHILMDVFSNPDYLKSGIKSAIKLESLDEFIDRTTLKQVGILGGKMVVDGFREAIDAHSNSKEAERAVDDFANGVVDEFEKRTEDMAQSAKKAGDAVTEAFGNSLKDSMDELDELLPNKEVTSGVADRSKYTFTEDDVDRIYDRHANDMLAAKHNIDDLQEELDDAEADKRELQRENAELRRQLSESKPLSPVEQFYKEYGTPSRAMDRGFNTDEVLKMLGGKFAEMDVDDVRDHEWKLNLEFFKELLKYAELTEDELDVVKAAMIEIEQYGEGGKYRHLIGNEFTANEIVGDRLKLLDQIFKKEHEISEQELENAKITLKYERERDNIKKTSSLDQIENNLTSGTTAPSQIDEATDNIIEFKKNQEETINPDLRNGYERMTDSISELGSEYKESEKFATEFLHAIQEIQDIHKLPVLDDSQYNRMQEIYKQFPEVLEFFAKYPQYMNGWVDEDSIDDWFTFLETLPKAKEFLKVQEQISDFADYDERVSDGGIHFDDEYLEEINQKLQQATGKEENFIEKYKEIIDLFSSGQISEIQTIKSILEKEMPYYNYYVSEDTGFIKGIPKTRKEIEELGLSAKETSHIIEELYGKTGQLKTKSNEKIIDASHLFGRSSNETPVLFQESDGQLSMFEEIANAKREDAKATEELIDAEKRLSDIPGQMSIDDFADLDKQSDVSSSTEEIDKATEAIKQEGEAAEKSAQQKKAFVDANKEVAKSGSVTADGINEATEAIKKEGKAVSESKIDVSDFEKMVNVSKDLKEQLGGVVDVYQQVRRSMDPTKDDAISYRLVGKNGYAWVGQNGNVLKKNIKTGDDLTQEKEQAKRDKELENLVDKANRDKARQDEKWKKHLSQLGTSEQTSELNDELNNAKELRNKYDQKTKEEAKETAEAIKYAVDTIKEAEKSADNIANKVEKAAESANEGAEKYDRQWSEFYGNQKNKKDEQKLYDLFKEADELAANYDKKVEQQHKQLKKASSDRIVAKEKARQEEINRLLKEQKGAYQEVLNIRKEIAKLNPDDNAEEIAKLEEKKKTALQTYQARTKELKAIDETANAETQVNTLLEMRKRNLQEIAVIEGKSSDKAQSKLKKTYDSIFQKIDTSEYDLDFELKNGNHTAEFNQELSELLARVRELKANPPDIITQKDIDEAKELAEEIRQIRKSGGLTANKKANENSIQKGLAQINSILSGNTKSAFRRTDVYKDLVELQTLFKSFDASRPQSELAELMTSLLKAKARFEELDDTVKGAGFFNTFVERLRGINAQLLAQYFSWHDIIRYGRTMVSTIISLDDSLLDLRKTTVMNNTELEEFYHNASDIGKQLGSTTQEIIDQASAWSRLGFNTKEAATEMAKISSQFAAISPGMSTEEAQSGLVSIIKAWNIPIQDVQREVLDNINVLGGWLPKHMVTYGALIA